MKATVQSARLSDRTFVRMFALLAVWSVVQLGLLSQPVQFDLPMHQQVGSASVTLPAQRGMVDWAKIEGVKSLADLAPKQAVQAEAEPRFMAPYVPVNWPSDPRWLEIPSLGIRTTIIPSEFGRTSIGAANIPHDWTPAGAYTNLPIWGYDMGWKYQPNMPFAPLREGHVEVGKTRLILHDYDGEAFRYVLTQVLVVERHEVEYIDLLAGDSGQVTIIGTAGDLIRNADGRVVDSTHRKLYIFEVIDLGYELRTAADYVAASLPR